MLPSISIFEKLSLFLKVLLLPWILIYTLAISPFSEALKRKRTRRLLFEAYVRYFTTVATAGQVQWFVGPTRKVYRAWTRQWKIQPSIEDVPQSGQRLMWIGDKNAEKVIFYVHGGGFVLPISDFMFTFWLYVRREYAKRTGGRQLAIVTMEYSLHPHAFPTQLTEMTHAISHIIKTSGISLSNLYIAGDSAGGNLVLQFISHTLNPLPVDQVPPSSLIRGQPIAGILLVSPWLSLDRRLPSHTRNAASDCITVTAMEKYSLMYLAGMRDSHVPYVNVLSAGDGWFDGVDELTDRVLVTVGGAECLLDDGVGVYEKIKASAARGKRRIEVDVDVEDGGVHEDMMMECGAGGRKLTAVGEKVVSWLID